MEPNDKPKNPPLFENLIPEGDVPYEAQAHYRFTEITLRDLFAAAALGAMTAAPDYSKGPCNAAMAERAYTVADHMLREREKGGEE